MNTYTEAQHEVTTVRILRLALVNLDNQQMTVAELRRKLFDVDDQDGEIELLNSALWRKLGIEESR